MVQKQHLTLVQDNSSVIRIDSGNGVFMKTETGNLVIDRLVNTDGNINLTAGQEFDPKTQLQMHLSVTILH